ncbi:MAG TPA: hypothetical protein VFE14_04330 [Micromonosporaceae bacterium]|nr:hypothetical protein [Micromonosporaceae bacterium]
MPPEPKTGAQCGNPARWDLCGGPPVRAVPTATILTGGVGHTLHRDLSGLRSILRFAPDTPAEFAARLATARVAKTDDPVRSYTEPEFRRITAKARSDVRAAAQRIRAATSLLRRWRAGEIDKGIDKDRWEQGYLLDHVDRFGDVPRYPGGIAHQIVRRHGGIDAVMARLHLTHYEIGAAGVLLICLTGHNFSTVGGATVDHHRPDGHAGGPATAIITLVKPRRASRDAEMTVALRDITPDGATPAHRDDLTTPFGTYQLLLELGEASRRCLGTDQLFVHYSAKGHRGRGFRAGLPKQVLQLWSYRVQLAADETEPDTGAPKYLHVDSRRLRLTWLEIHQRPVAQTEQTLANEYLARNRGNLTEYQKIVAEVLDQQVARARQAAPIPVLSEQDVRQARVDPAAVAARHGISQSALAELIGGRLDTVLTGCTDNLHSPHSPAGQPCRASFLLCLSCPCARATPAHLPVQVLVHDALLARRAELTPLRWAQRFAEPTTRLTDLLDRHTPAAIADARAAASGADNALVERFLTRGLDLT